MKQEGDAMTLNQQRFAWITIGLWIAILLPGIVIAAENSPSEAMETPKASYDLPEAEAMEWRALDAELRAIRVEVQQAIMERNKRQSELIEIWRARYALKNINDWEVDFTAAKLRKRKIE